MILFIRH